MPAGIRIRSFSRGFPAVAALLLFTGLNGCSFLKLGYKHLDWVLYYSVNRQFDLHSDQKRLLRRAVDRYQAWHKEHMLPEYLDFIRWAARSLEDGADSAEIHLGFARYEDLRRRSMEPLVPAARQLLIGLDEKQLSAFRRRVRRKNDERRREYERNPGKALDERAEKTVEAIEDWTGRLTDRQKQAVGEMSRALPLNISHWLEYRERQASSLVKLVGAGDGQGLEAFLHAYLASPEILRTSGHQARVEMQEDGARAMIAAVAALLTPEQRRHAVRELLAFARDLESAGGRS